MMQLLHFAVAIVNCIGGKKNHGNHSNNNIDRRVTSSVNKYGICILLYNVIIKPELLLSMKNEQCPDLTWSNFIVVNFMSTVADVSNIHNTINTVL